MAPPAPSRRQLELLGEIAAERRWVGYARQFLPTEEDAEDAVQEAVIRSMPQLHRMYTTPGQSRRWWSMMLKWTCLNRRRRRDHADHFALEDLEAMHAEPADRGADVEMIDQEELHHLLDAIAGLPQRRRELLEAVLDTNSTQEAAERLGLGETAVKSRLFRLRADLRDSLHAEFAAES